MSEKLKQCPCGKSVDADGGTARCSDTECVFHEWVSHLYWQSIPRPGEVQEVWTSPLRPKEPLFASEEDYWEDYGPSDRKTGRPVRTPVIGTSTQDSAPKTTDGCDTEKVNSGRGEMIRDPFIGELEQAIQAMARAKATQEFRTLTPCSQRVLSSSLRAAVFELESVESAYVAVQRSKLPRSPQEPLHPPYGLRVPPGYNYFDKKGKDPEGDGQ